MKHLKKFEAFLIPKPIRKFHPWWNDEDIALQVLKELKSMKRDTEAIQNFRLHKKQNHPVNRRGGILLN